MLGPRIAALRRDAGMSQAALAKQLRISPSAVGMYEQGRREPSADTLVAIAEIFQVSTDYLLTGRPQQASERDKLSRMLRESLGAAERQARQREKPGFSRQELAILVAAMLMEP